MKAGFFEEADGSRSMRRLLAAVLTVGALVLFALATIKGAIVGCYGGGGCLVAALVLLFFTTWSDIKGVILAVKGIDAAQRPNEPGADRGGVAVASDTPDAKTIGDAASVAPVVP